MFSGILFRVIVLAGILGAAGLPSSVAVAAPDEGEAPTPVIIGETRVLRSEVLGEDRSIRVYTPAGYEEEDSRYPVLYLLDGDTHFHHVSGIVDYLSSLGRIPGMIVVGLANTERARDFTFETEQELGDRFPESGGAHRFSEFLQKELVPFIDDRYRTHPYRVITGHSFGGLFVLFMLVTSPDTFGGYAALSPSLWWDRGSLVADARNFMAGMQRLEKQVVIVTGGESDDSREGVNTLGAVLRAEAPEGLAWNLQSIASENRATIPHRGAYVALEWIYRDWIIGDLPGVLGAGGIEAVDAHYVALSERYGYEIPTPEGVVNNAGYWYMSQRAFDLAIEVLKRNVRDYPESANVYDSLGDAYDARGQLILARHNYEKAVEIAEATDHPFLAIYQANLERIRKKIRDEEPGS